MEQGQPSMIPVIEIAFRNDMWWSLPVNMSQQLYDRFQPNETDIGYTWDWGNTRAGSWAPDGQETSINRYLPDFETMQQRNLDNNKRESFRIAWMRPEPAVPARWTGEIQNYCWTT